MSSCIPTNSTNYVLLWCWYASYSTVFILDLCRIPILSTHQNCTCTDLLWTVPCLNQICTVHWMTISIDIVQDLQLVSNSTIFVLTFHRFPKTWTNALLFNTMCIQVIRYQVLVSGDGLAGKYVQKGTVWYRYEIIYWDYGTRTIQLRWLLENTTALIQCHSWLNWIITIYLLNIYEILE